MRNVLERLKNLPPPFSEQKTNEHLKAIAELAGIGKKITTHVARHSFAVRCLELKMSEETVAHYMGITVRTVKHYAKVTSSKLDSEFAAWDKLAGA